MNKKLFYKNTAGLTIACFGQCIFASLMSMALPMFFTDVLLIAPAGVSLIFLLTRIWDSVNDPFMGIIVDKTRTRWGKCRPYLLFSAFPLMVITVLLFTPISTESMALKFAYALTTYILFVTICTSIDIPLAGVKPLMYTVPDERNKAMSISSTFGSIGSLLAIDFFFIFVDLIGKQNVKRGYFLTILLLSGVGCLSLLGGFFMIKEVVPVGQNKKIPLRRIFKTVLKNRYLIIAIIVQLSSIGITAYGILLPYFSKWNLADSFSFGRLSVEAVLIPVVSTATGLIYMVAIMITPYLLKLADKRTIFIAMSAIGAVLNIVSFLCGYQNLILFIALRVLAHIPPSITGCLTGYMVMDCMDYAEYQSGERTEGTSYAINNLFASISNAVFTSLITFLLGVFGYNAAVTGPALKMGESMAFNYPGMLDGIFIMMTIFPAIALLVQIIPIIFYKLNDKRVNEIAVELQNRRNKLEKSEQGEDVSICAKA